MADELINDWWRNPTAWLSQEKQDHNAWKIYNWFIGYGWTVNAISGMLANIHSESRVNPAIWQGKVIPNNWETTERGYGLTQWTPARKYINWALANGFTDYGDGDANCSRIIWEWQNKEQWTLKNYGHHTWNDFVYSTETPEILARVFLWAYERPEKGSLSWRQQWARYYYDMFGGSQDSPPDPGPDPSPTPTFNFDELILIAGNVSNKKRRGKRIEYI